jgi:hypothetical protein
MALNYQVNDQPMQLNRAFFGRGGSTGYVLKPVEMRQQGSSAKLSVAVAANVPAADEAVADGQSVVSMRVRRNSAAIEVQRMCRGKLARRRAASVPAAVGPRSEKPSAVSTAARNPPADATDVAWPPLRRDLCVLRLRLLAVYHLPTQGECRPVFTDSEHHQYVRQLSGTPCPPSCSSVATPSIGLSVHTLGGFGAVTPSLDELRRRSNSSASFRTPPAALRGGLCAAFDVPADCVVAELWAAMLRFGVFDNDDEVAYEAVIVGAMRTGYRCLQLREPTSGTLIDGCSLLLHVEYTTTPRAWVDDPKLLSETVVHQAATIDEQAAKICEQAQTIARLTKEVQDLRASARAPSSNSLNRPKLTAGLSISAPTDVESADAPAYAQNGRKADLRI